MPEIVGAGVSGNVIRQPSVTVDIITRTPETGETVMNSAPPVDGPLYPPGAWDLANTKDWVTSGSKKLVISAQGTQLRALYLSPDGSKIFVGSSSADRVLRYDMSTPWDVSTATFTSFFYVGAQDGGIQGLFFKNDGTRMYITGFTGNRVFQYDLVSAWDITTAAYLTVNFSLSGFTDTRELFIRDDGLRFFVINNGNDNISQYSMSTAWDMATASTDSFNKSVGPQETGPYGVHFKPDCSRMFICGNIPASAFQYDLSDSENISTAVYNSITFPIAQDTLPFPMFMSANGDKLYIGGAQTESVYQYDVSL